MFMKVLKVSVHESVCVAALTSYPYCLPDHAPTSALNSAPLKAGMTVSNEPGYYADGRFGIRIENIVLVREAKTPNNFGDKGYLCFENVTMSVVLSSMDRHALY